VALSPNRRTGEALIALAQDHLDDDELDEAQWALDRLRRLGSQSTAAALYYMAQLSQQRGDPGGARELLLQLTTDHPDSDRADDALALLAAMVADDEGCQRARPLYTRLLESYSTSGWATVARAALRRCAEREALLEGQEGGRP
jgi:TolA-binding protein